MTERYSSEHETGENNIQVMGLDIHNPVFFISGALTVLFVLVTLYAPETVNHSLLALRAWCLVTFDSFVMISVNLFLLFVIALVLLPVGKIRLGGDNCKPEFSYLSWLAMLFAAGVGIGLMFWGVAEPIAYYTDWAGTPFNVEPWTPEAARLAMSAAVYHWGLHGWAIYAIVALALAFFAFNCGLPLTLRSAFYPLLGERCWGWAGDVIDTIAALATIFGLTTSLGLGAAQVNAGFTLLMGVEDSFSTKLWIIVGIIGVAIFSVVRGLDAGIKFLSNLNMTMAALLLLFVAVVGAGAATSGLIPTVFNYLLDAVPLSNWVGRADGDWMRDWTVFFWAWWISWSPFVGLFIARVSKGRTVRELIVAVLIMPTLVTTAWMTIFGLNAIEQASNGVGALANGVSSISGSTFQMLENLPMAEFTMPLALVLIMIFFITSADSGSLVVDSITAGGKLDSPLIQRVFWAVMIGLIAAVLLYVGGENALKGLQAGAIATGIPFTALILLMCVCVYQGLRESARGGFK